MERKDFTYTYSANGYMLYYKDKPIGGAGVMLPREKPLHWRHKRANLTMFRTHAESDITAILNGKSGHYETALAKIARK